MSTNSLYFCSSYSLNSFHIMPLHSYYSPTFQPFLNVLSITITLSHSHHFHLKHSLHIQTKHPFHPTSTRFSHQTSNLTPQYRVQPSTHSTSIECGSGLVDRSGDLGSSNCDSPLPCS